MSPITPLKRKGSMCPPSSSSQWTPSTASPRSVITTPQTGSSSSGRGRSQTPFQVKSEPVDRPSPSPRMSRAPSTLPPMSPMSGAMVPYRARTPSSTPSSSRRRNLSTLGAMSGLPEDGRVPSEPFSIPRARYSTPSRHRYPSEASSVGRSRAPSSARSMSTFSLAESDTGFRIGRRDTAEYDGRTRNVRPRGSREGSAPIATPSAPSLPILPATILEPAAAVTNILGDLFVQDIDAEEGSGEKDKEEFKQECLKLIADHLFDGAGLAERILQQLADEEVVVGFRLVNRLVDVMKSGVQDILTSTLKDFVIDCTKIKSKSARQMAWYAKYRARIPGSAQLLSDLNKADSSTIVSLLAQEWSTNLPALQAQMVSKSVTAKKGHCRSITESVRRLCDVLISDIWNVQN